METEVHTEDKKHVGGTANGKVNDDAADQCVLVTGGAGYIGSHTAVELLNAGYSVVIVDNLSNSSIECIQRIEEVSGKSVVFHRVDILDDDALEKVFQQHKFSAVLHFAGYKAVAESCQQPLTYYYNNVTGSIRLVEAMKRHRVFKLVFSSSCTVYGEPDREQLPVNEDSPVGHCTNPYGWSKYTVERVLKDLCAAEKEWSVILLRYFNPVGAHKSGRIGEDPHGIPVNLMPYVAQVAVGRRPELHVFGGDYDTPDGTCVRDYIHVVDLALGHIAAMAYLEKRHGCRVFNLGIGVGHSVLEVVAAFEKASGRKIPYRIVGRRPGDVVAIYSTTELAAAELGWSARRDLHDMCADMWRWQSTNPDGYHKDSA